MIVTLDAKRRVSLPAMLTPAKPGDQFEATVDADDGTVTLRRIPPKKNWIDVMEACPEPIDDLPHRSREMPKERHL